MLNKEELRLLKRKMTFTGRGQVTVNPDLAIIRLGVQTTGENVNAAQQENARISSQILNAVKGLGVNNIKTFQYQIEKLVDYENGNRVDRGFSVRNIFEIKTENLGQVGPIIDTAVLNGANLVEFINFDVAHPDTYYQQALNLAVKNAYQKAKTVASSLKFTFDPIPVLITENVIPAVPYSASFAVREGAYATPIESGSKQIEAYVTVDFIY